MSDLNCEPSAGIVRSRCGAVRIGLVAGEPSAGFVRVESLPLWRGASFERKLRTLSLFSAGPQNSVCDRRLSRGFRPFAALVRGASSEFCSRSTTLSWFLAVCGAGAWSVLRILFAIDNPLVVFSRLRCWRAERPQNSVRDRRVERPANLCSPAGISFFRSTSLVLQATFPWAGWTFVES